MVIILVNGDLSHGVVLFKGMMQLALTSVCISLLGKIKEGLHLFQVSARAQGIFLIRDIWNQ